MVIIETSVFTRQVQELLTDDEYRGLQMALIARPDAGALIVGSGGLRKLRWAARGKGKRGSASDLLLGGSTGSGTHAPHLCQERTGRSITGSSQSLEKDNRRGISMKDELFDELIASVREGGAILRGETAPSRKFVIEIPDVKRIRASYHLSQGEFAALLGISVATLRNWEQGRRTPEGPARILLQVAAKHPDALWDVVRPATRPPKSKSAGKQARATIPA